MRKTKDIGRVIKNRIVGYEDVPLDQVQFNPKNWRIHPKHQQDALNGVLSEVGVVQNVIVNRRTGNLVDGHLRVTLADRNGEKTIPATIVDLSPEEEAMILATLDPLSALAATDHDKLSELLEEVQTNDAAILDMLGLGEQDGDDPGMVPLELEDAKTTWVVLSCPTVRYGAIADMIQRIARTEGVACEVIVSDKDGQRQSAGEAVLAPILSRQVPRRRTAAGDGLLPGRWAHLETAPKRVQRRDVFRHRHQALHRTAQDRLPAGAATARLARERDRRGHVRLAH